MCEFGSPYDSWVENETTQTLYFLESRWLIEWSNSVGAE
jgi:hypothetical protein